MILEMLVVGPFASNSYIVGSETTKEGIIIDPGAGAKTIVERAHKLGLSITLIVATHTHVDHIAALGAVKEATGAKFALHEAEADSKLSHGIARMLGPVVGGGWKELPHPDILLHEGDTVNVGELSFEVLHTPGHSPGGISLVGHGVVFCGDTLFNLGIGRTDFPGCSYDQLMESIFTKLMVLPDETIVYSGHGPETTIGEERRWNPFLRR